MEEQVLEAPKKRRSGSEKRQRYCRVTIRLTPEEFATLQADAEAIGQEVAPYMRERCLTSPKLRRVRRRLTVEVVALTRTLGQLNRVGGNIHQLVKRVNFGEMPNPEDWKDALAGYNQTVSAIMEALGRGPLNDHQRGQPV